jgi:ribosomal protein L17
MYMFVHASLQVITMAKKATRQPPYETEHRSDLLYKELFGDDAAERRPDAWVQTERGKFKLLTELMERYRDRRGGYVRVVK